jgi:hypothetical protein
MNQYLILNPAGNVYSVMAYDIFEAIHKAKPIDGHIFNTKLYKQIKLKK